MDRLGTLCHLKDFCFIDGMGGETKGKDLS